MDKNPLKPFVKWVGGKRQLLNEIRKRLPLKFNNYFEPFVGGGAVLFEFQPKNASINDVNSELIWTYNVIKKNLSELSELLKILDSNENNNEIYYERRTQYNKKVVNKQYDVELAALFIYLNKRCFNGLYRVNRDGLFNVPYNNKKSVKSFEEDNLERMSRFLRSVNITNLDFEESLSQATKGDFIFIDSPYVPLNETSFDSYTKYGFGYEEHLRLANLFRNLDKKGCYVMLTNSNSSLVHELYKDFNIEIVEAKRMINCDAANRVATEVIITNY